MHTGVGRCVGYNVDGVNVGYMDKSHSVNLRMLVANSTGVVHRSWKIF